MSVLLANLSESCSYSGPQLRLFQGTIDFQENFSHTWEISANNNKEKAIHYNQYAVFVAGIGLIYLTTEVSFKRFYFAAVANAVAGS